MSRVIASALLGLALFALGVPAAHAAPGDITITSPSGTSIASGPVTIAGINNTASSVYLDVSCPSNDYYEFFSVAPGEFSHALPAITGPASCEIDDDSDATTYATFSVQAPVTTVSDAGISPTVFYPLVRDGYRDTVSFSWRQNHDGAASIAVINPATGATVRTATRYGYQGRNTWTWNGARDSGVKVATGRYRIRVRANSNSVAAAVQVAKATVVKSFSLRKEGNEGAAFATRGSCYATRDDYNAVADLDCWGGSFARATYHFTLPAGAYDVHGVVALMNSSADICCRGRITKGWSHPSARSVVLWAKCTGWRATSVNYVRVTYKRRVNI